MKAANIPVNRRCPSFRRMGALAALLLFVALHVFAVSGNLHKAIHADASSPAHTCVITLLAQGQVNAPVVPVIWVFAAGLIFLRPLVHSAVLSSLDLRLSPGRAPPRF
jgi:hypothetical protein